jgi:hypothetical protein
MQKYKSSYFIAGFLLIPALVVGYYFLATSSGEKELARIEAKSKSKWQQLLEKNNIPLSFWQKYLPYVRHSEYNKAMKAYNGANNSGSGTSVQQSSLNGDGSTSFALHSNIKTTYFWAGEDASGDNYGISNNSSCWDETWDKHCKNENQFYFALPYNDFDNNGNRKKEALSIIPWASEKTWSGSESMCKNRWIKINHNGKTAYAQWEDAGPCDDAGGCGENDKNYVFGTAAPKFKVGLDVSPAVKNYLGLDDEDVTSWQFIDQKDIPDGPWSKVVTTSGVNWN